MSKLSRASLVLLFAAGFAVGPAGCDPNQTVTSRSKSGGATGQGGSGDKGGSGGSGESGGSAAGGRGGAGGSAAGGIGSAGGSGGGGGSAGSAAGSGGRGGGGGSAAGGSAGSAAGGGGGTGGTARGGSGGGTGGSGGTGDTRADAGPDAARDAGADRFESGRDQANRDTPPVPDAPPADDAGNCPAGQSACGTSCYDLQTNASHCGACTVVCGSGQTCNAGACTEGGSAGDTDGCSDVVASDLTLSQIAVYQSVKIPIMKDGAAVATASRNAPVVQGRTTMFRVFVTAGSGFSERELAARLTLTPSDGQPTRFYSRKTLRGSSGSETDLASSFQIFVPASAMAGSVTYSVEVVECGSPAGDSGKARFPETGDADLGVKTTGGMKIRFIPFSVGSLLPDTSAAAIASYADAVMAMYPTNAVSIDVGGTISTSTPLDWSGMLDELRNKRRTDAPANDVYYFGLVKPADTLRTYCQGSCTTGIGFVVTSTTGSYAGSARCAIGVGFNDSASRDTMLHELGHNHGREHAPCSVSPADARYPYSGGLIGVWGYDARTQKLFDPAKVPDIMSYCNNKWVSDYTYTAFATRVAAVNGATMVYTPASALSTWRVLWLGERGPRWGRPITEPAAGEGEPEVAVIHDEAGRALTSVTVYRTNTSHGGSMVMVPEPRPGWHAVAVAGAPSVPFAVAR